MPNVLTICPSWQRGGGIDSFINAWGDTCSVDNTLLIALDETDSTLGRYLNRVSDANSVLVNVGPRMKMAPKVNRVFRDHPDYDYYVFVGDDHRFRTPNWDEILIERNVRGVSYGDDLHQGEKLPTAFMLDGKVARALGYIFYPTLEHLYVDDYIKALGLRTYLRYVPEVVIEHLHPHAGKAEMDSSYMQSNAAEQYQKDQSAFRQIHWDDVQAKLNRVFR